MDPTLPQELVKQVGGSFRLTALLQKRVRELVRVRQDTRGDCRGGVSYERQSLV